MRLETLDLTNMDDFIEYDPKENLKFFLGVLGVTVGTWLMVLGIIGIIVWGVYELIF